MKLRHFLLAAAIVAAFIYFTTYLPVGPFEKGRWRGALPWEGETSPVPGVTLAQSGGFGSDEQNNIQVYKAASPAVVNVTTITLTYDFFLNPVPMEGGAGSGFLIEPDGKIVTNFHVISGARRVQVMLADRSRHQADVLGYDDRSDLAVLRIQAGAGIALSAAGRVRQPPGGAEGAGYREPVRPVPEYSDHGSHQLARGAISGAAAVARFWKTSFKRTPPSIPATVAGPCSTRTGKSWASTRPSSARPILALDLPFPSTG